MNIPRKIDLEIQQIKYQISGNHYVTSSTSTSFVRQLHVYFVDIIIIQPFSSSSWTASWWTASKSSWSGMQAAWRWHRWQRIQIILRWSRASGWGQKNMIFVLIKICFYSKLSFICFMYQVSIHDKEDQTAVRECICWEFSTNFYISIFFLFTFIPSYEIVRPKYIYLLPTIIF